MNINITQECTELASTTCIKYEYTGEFGILNITYPEINFLSIFFSGILVTWFILYITKTLLK